MRDWKMLVSAINISVLYFVTLIHKNLSYYVGKDINLFCEFFDISENLEHMGGKEI